VTVYLDQNNNGARDPSEPFDITDANGAYLISSLAIGTYTARVDTATLPVGLAATFDLDGGSHSAAAAALTAGIPSRTDVDFGYRGTASIGDFVWNDLDGDGIQNAGERTFVKLYNVRYQRSGVPHHARRYRIWRLPSLLLPALPCAEAIIGRVLIGIRKRWVVVHCHDERINRGTIEECVRPNVHQLRRQLADVVDAEELLVGRRKE
jgi:hypothetical protein